jgi:hypothetical protein
MLKSRVTSARFTKLGTWVAAVLFLCAISSVPIIVQAADNPAASATDDTGFQPIDLNKVEKIDGKSLTILAYGIIFGVFVLFAASLLKREKTVEKEARELERQLK